MISIFSVLLSLAFAAGNSEAPQGGQMVLNIQGRVEPPTIHPISSLDVGASQIHDYTLATLLTKDPQTFEWKPYLAEKWEISKDGKIFTFWLRNNLTFHDGKPLTAEDVKFTFDAIMDSKYDSSHLRPYYEGISKVEIVDPLQVKFFTKEVYFLNFDFAAGLATLLNHVYSDLEKSKKMTKEIVGSGPYRLDKFEKGQKIILKKYSNWFGKTVPELKGIYNLDTLVFRFIKDEKEYLKMLNSGELDFDELSPEQYMTKTEGGNWGKKVFKFKVENKVPKGYRFIAWNLENPLFKEKNVRLALAYLMNRAEMIKKFRFDLSAPATGPSDYFSDYASPSVAPIVFDEAKAQELLAKEGWKDSDKDGTLDKIVNGKKMDFRFVLIQSNKEYEKYLMVYKADLKKAGIEMEVKYLEWPLFIKLVDDGKFDALSLARMTTVEFDPKPFWHSAGTKKGGSNFSHYRSPEVDRLIDQARAEMDRKKRIQLLRKVYEKIAADVPYVFMFNEKYSFYALSNRIGQPASTFDYSLGTEYWWVKP
ncbi:MAG: ABC transporter substrate-binding protein [Pseudobdellovibrionaceae bacterium]